MAPVHLLVEYSHPLRQHARTECKNAPDERRDELQNLQERQVLLPPNIAATRMQCVVEVHHDVNEQVDDDREPLNATLGPQLRPTQNQRGGMMIDVKKRDGFASQGEKEGVDEFHILENIVDKIDEINRSADVCTERITRERPQAVRGVNREQLRDEREEQDGTADGHGAVVSDHILNKRHNVWKDGARAPRRSREERSGIEEMK